MLCQDAVIALNNKYKIEQDNNYSKLTSLREVEKFKFSNRNKSNNSASEQNIQKILKKMGNRYNPLYQVIPEETPKKSNSSLVSSIISPILSIRQELYNNRISYSNILLARAGLKSKLQCQTSRLSIDNSLPKNTSSSISEVSSPKSGTLQKFSSNSQFSFDRQTDSLMLTNESIADDISLQDQLTISRKAKLHHNNQIIKSGRFKNLKYNPLLVYFL